MKKSALSCLLGFKCCFLAISSLFFLLSHLSAYGQGDTINCQDFQLREFRKLCQDTVSKSYIYVVVHDSISGDLSTLAKAWSQNTFHIIPPDTYLVSSTVVLDNVILLPHPKTNSGSGTIELKASESFSSSRTPLSLISLTNEARAGGIEIQGGLLPDSLFNTSSKNVFLVDFPSAANSMLTGTILVGRSRLSGLVHIEDGNAASTNNAMSNDESGVLISRNFLKLNGAASGIHIESSSHKSSTVRAFNNAFLIDSVASGTSATAIINTRGKTTSGNAADLYLNDFVFVRSDSNKPRYGIEVERAHGTFLHGNAFYSQSSTPGNNDIGIFSHKYPASDNRWVISSGNAFSPNIVIGKSSVQESGKSINFIDSGSVKLVNGSNYPRMTPAQFFAETGHLGYVPYPVSALLEKNNSTCPSFNQSTLYSRDDYNYQTVLAGLRNNDQACDRCETVIEKYGVDATIKLALGGFFILTILASPLSGWGFYSCFRGKCALPWR